MESNFVSATLRNSPFFHVDLDKKLESIMMFYLVVLLKSCPPAAIQSLTGEEDTYVDAFFSQKNSANFIFSHKFQTFSGLHMQEYTLVPNFM